jgi:hypothetical protein
MRRGVRSCNEYKEKSIARAVASQTPVRPMRVRLVRIKRRRKKGASQAARAIS